MTRLEFLKVTLALAGAHLVGCGDDSSGGDAAADTGSGPDGSGPDGSGPDGSGPDGSTPDGSSGDGSTPDGSSGDGSTPDGSSGDGGGSACSGASIEASVSNNHGHTLTIPVADIVAGVDKDYVTGGTTGHCHIVTLTAADFAALRAGEVVRVVSCNNTEHEYALSCASMPMAMDPAPTCGASDEGRYTGTCTGGTFTP